MSGGTFDYKQHFIEYMADEIEQRILKFFRCASSLRVR